MFESSLEGGVLMGLWQGQGKVRLECLIYRTLGERLGRDTGEGGWG